MVIQNMSDKISRMPCRLDREVSDPNSDSFGHRDFAEALKDLIENDENVPPYSIGLLGSWGTGKSSIKSLYCKGLETDNSKDDEKCTRRERYKEITFNAWSYGGNANIKRALLRHVFLELGGTDQSYNDNVLNTIVEKFPDEINLAKQLEKIRGHVINTLIYAGCVGAILFLFIVGVHFFIFNSFPEGTVIISFAFLLFITIAINYFIGKPTPFEKIVDKIRMKHPRTDIEEWESLLKSQIEKFSNIKTNKNYKKIIVFVDDLDRLSATEMVEGLDGIRTFMEICLKGKCPNLGVVFVISCDESRVAEALRSRNNSSDIPGAIRFDDDARRYLDRIFQFRLEIPPFPRHDLRKFALAELEKIYPQFIEELEQNGLTKEAFISQLIPPSVTNPRNAIQLINTFSQAWWIAKIREENGADENRPAGLYKGAITKYPLTLAIFCVLKVNFPHFYNKLLRHPTIIEDYSRVILRGDDEWYKTLNINVKYLLIEYLEKPQPQLNNEANGENGNLSKNDLKSVSGRILLRDYMWGIQTHNWPKTSLQPFIELNQDTINRKHPKLTNKVLFSLMQGLPEATLKILNTSGNEKISDEHAAGLIDLLEIIRLENVMQNTENASYVICSILQNIPDAYQSRIGDYVKLSLQNSPKLRELVGIDKLLPLMKILSFEDQSRIVDVLVEDTFGGEKFEFKLQSLKEPTVENAIDLATRIIDVSLLVWQDLTPTTKSTIINWLSTRQVVLATGTSPVKISVIENFMEKYEDPLLNSLNLKYTGIIIEEIVKGNEGELNLDNSLERCEKIFAKYCQGEGQDKITAWNQIASCVSAKNEKLVLLGNTVTEQFYGRADPTQLRTFIEKLTLRLIQDYEDHDHFGLKESRNCATTLNNLLDNADIKNAPSVLDNLKKLCEEYILGSPSKSTFGILYLQKLIDISRERAENIIISMSSKILDNIPETSTLWLSNNYHDKLNDKEKTAVTQTLDSFINAASIDPKKLEKYALFIESLSDESLAEKTIQDHISNAFVSIATNYTNFNDHGSKILPLLLPLVKRKIPETSGTNVTQLFNNVISQPPLNLLGKVHGYFVEYWSPNLIIESQNIFDKSLECFMNNPVLEHGGSVLISCNTIMKTYNILTDENKLKLVRCASIVWRNCPNDANTIIISYDTIPSPNEIAFELKPEDIDNPATYSRLKESWSHIIHLQHTVDDKITLFKAILLKPAIVSQTHGKDAALDLWFQLCDSDTKNSISHKLQNDPEINDSQYLRLWEVMIDSKDEISLEVISEFFKLIANNEKFPTTANSIVTYSQYLDNRLKIPAERHKFSEIVCDLFIHSNHQDRTRLLAGLISVINKTRKLPEKLLEAIPSLSQAKIDLLKETFPESTTTIDEIVNQSKTDVSSEEPKKEEDVR
jgi:hypothetical protein